MQQVSPNKISIIVPIYNVEKYAKQCLDSLIGQTYKNIEIICIDDGSTDQSAEVLKEYSNNDSRVKVIYQKNAGVSKARNQGIEQATGDFILFVDGDDWIEPHTCEVALKYVLKHEAEVVFWPYIREFPNHSKPKVIFRDDLIIFSKEDIKDRLHRRLCGLVEEELRYPENEDALSTVWGKLYRAELIKDNQIKFTDLDQIGSFEDGLFNFQLFNYVSKAIYINQYLSHYRRERATSLTTKYRPHLFSQWKNLFHLMKNYIDEHNLDQLYSQALNNRVALSIIGLGLNETRSDGSAINKIGNIKTIINHEQYKTAYKHLSLQYFPIHWKVFFVFAKHGQAWGIYILLNIIVKIRGK